MVVLWERADHHLHHKLHREARQSAPPSGPHGQAHPHVVVPLPCVRDARAKQFEPREAQAFPRHRKCHHGQGHLPRGRERVVVEEEAKPYGGVERPPQSAQIRPDGGPRYDPRNSRRG